MLLYPPNYIAAAGLVPPAAYAGVGKAAVYTSNAGTLSISGLGFSPDLVLIKSRLATNGWRWVDTSRGVTKALESNSQNAEITEAAGLTSFDTGGFTLGNDGDYNGLLSGSPTSYLALALKKRTNAFDIVTYTGTGVAHTINHGLGVVPELIITRSRGLNSMNWLVYPGPLASPATKFLLLNSNQQVGTSATPWNNTAPTSTVFTVGTSTNHNTNGDPCVAYLFASVAGKTKIGTYTGNGTTTGPAVNTGFTPRILIVKRADATTGDWVVWDDQRDSNPHNTNSLLNTNAVESTVTNGCDFQATGFQMKDISPNNVNTAVYLYLAIA